MLQLALWLLQLRGSHVEMEMCAAVCVMVCYRLGYDGGKSRCVMYLALSFVTG